MRCRAACVFALALLLASCHSPRTTAHYAGVFAGEGVPVLDLAPRCQRSAVQRSGWGVRMDCSCPGTEQLLHGPFWRVLDGESSILVTARGSRNVSLFLPPSAATIEMWMPANGTSFSFSAAGRREWRRVYVYILAVAEPTQLVALPDHPE